jgi:hypothetical protein
MSMRIVQCLILLGWFALWGVSAADNMLPKELKGTITRMSGRAVVVNWSITIESQAPDGTIKGRFSFEGSSCRFEGLALTGTYRDGALTLNVPAASSNCGPWEVKLKRTAASSVEFEGTAITGTTSAPANAFLKGA